MARTHGRVLTRIWQDADFRQASAGGQRIYVMLLSQPNLSHAGVIPLTIRRWAAMCRDTTAEQIETSLQEMHERRFLVVDWDTEEVLIRTLIRNDAVYKQPQLWGAVRAEVDGVLSETICRVLKDELLRLPEPVPEAVEAAIRSIIGPPDEPPPEPLVEGVPEPLPEPHREGSCARARAAPTPTPVPTPETHKGSPPRAHTRDARDPPKNGRRETVAQQNNRVLARLPDPTRFGYPA